MIIILKYFCFIAILVWSLNVIIGKYKLQHLIDENLILQSDVNKFLLGYLLAGAIPFLFIILNLLKLL